MTVQNEKPGIPPAVLLACIGLPPATVAHVSGGQIENFRQGWAHELMTKSDASHWFIRDGFADADALCGLRAPVRWLYGAGNYPRCQNCIKRMATLIRQGRL